MKVSIIIPAYNAEKTILNTLKKLKQQTFKNFETVIINDGSVDSTSAIVRSFIDNNKLNWQLINQKNKGEGEARNTGLKYAKGEYILFLDADDYLSNDALVKLYNAIIQKEAAFSFSSYSYVYENGSKKLYYHPNKVYQQEEIMKLFFRRLANPGIGNTLIKKSIIECHNLKFEKYKAGADNHFFRRLLLFVNKVVSIEDNLFFYMHNDNSVMNRKYSFNRMDSINSVFDTMNEYKIRNVDDEILKYLDIFLINEIKGNAMDFYLSTNDDKQLQDKILSFLPKNVKISLFFSNKRTLWLSSLFIFYKFPISSLKIYKLLKGLKK